MTLLNNLSGKGALAVIRTIFPFQGIYVKIEAQECIHSFSYTPADSFVPALCGTQPQGTVTLVDIIFI